MRVIAGTRRGTRLHSVRGRAVRPTADRVRESLFSILAGDVRDRRVLDLFAGTGALGIETLSRGAARAVFVDFDRRSLKAIRENVRRCRFEGCAHVMRWDLNRDPTAVLTARAPFDLVFMDPPYASDLSTLTLRRLGDGRLLDDDATVVVEHGRAGADLEIQAPFRRIDRRRYGKTLVSFIQYVLS